MDNFNEINSYNSLMMSPENKKSLECQHHTVLQR